ncbi:MAG: hypothetical protein HKN35_15785 [Woeseia sp.]|nr:hypothetical protein [Woeseia sp.]
MAEFDPHATVNEAITEIAKGGVRTASDPTGSVEYMSLADLIAAKRFLDSQTAATQPHFGVRMTKQVPPGTG